MIIPEEALEESIEKLDIILKKKHIKPPVFPLKELKKNDIFSEKETVFMNKRYKETEEISKENEKFIKENPENQYDEEKFENEDSPVNFKGNITNFIEKGNKGDKDDKGDKGDKGYAHLHKKKNEEPSEIIRINEEIEEKSENLEGKIKILDKENLKKLLLD